MRPVPTILPYKAIDPERVARQITSKVLEAGVVIVLTGK